MKASSKVFVLLAVITLVLVSALNCLEAKPKGQEVTKDDMTVPKGPDVSTPTSEPLGQFKTQKLFQDTFGHRINYGSPELYLTSGTQSNLDQQYLNEVSRQIRIGNNDIENIGMIFQWKQSYFKTYAAGGKFVGKTTVNQLMKDKVLSGCHDHGLMLVSILRRYGFPAIMVDAAGIQWAMDYSQGKREGFRGHVFVEVYAKDNWILVNSTSGEYVEHYDPCNPVIPITDSVESKGYYALFKGLDPESYGISSNEQLTERLKVFAAKVNTVEMSFPPYKIKRLPQ